MVNERDQDARAKKLVPIYRRVHSDTCTHTRTRAHKQEHTPTETRTRVFTWQPHAWAF